MLKHKKHIFFDLDDTLWDFQKNSITVLKDLFVEFELEVKLGTGFDDFFNTYKHINHALWLQYNKREVDKNHIRNERFNLTFKEFNYHNYNENLEITELYLERAPRGRHLKEGCMEILNYLKPNYTLHIITNGFKEIQAIKIDGAGFRNYFNQIIVSEEHQMVKPETALFRLAEKLSGAKTNECVMIGDNFDSDITGAINAGWEPVYFTHEKNENYSGQYIENLLDLKKFF